MYNFDPSPEEQEALAQKYYGYSRPNLRWKDLNEQEQRGMLEEWRERQQAASAEDHRIAQQVEARMAAAQKRSEPREPKTLQLESLADLCKQLGQQPAGTPVGAHLFANTLRQLSKELSVLLTAQHKRIEKTINDAVEETYRQVKERYAIALRAKEAEISALRETNDLLAWRLEEAQALLGGTQVKPPSARAYARPNGGTHG